MIKNLIFDIGDVLMGYRWQGVLLDHGLEESRVREIEKILFSSRIWENMDRGTMDEDQAIEAYKKECPEYGDDIEWFIHHANLLNVERPDVWKRVHELKKKGYRIYLLSNYSEYLYRLHIEKAPFLDDTDGKVISFQVHMLKPEKEIYQFILNKYHLNPAECIFFDDRAANTKGAIDVGIDAVTITSKEHLLEVLSKY